MLTVNEAADRVRRVDELVRAVCPIDGVALAADDSVKVLYAKTATADEIRAAQAVVAGLDTSPTADADWKAARTKASAKAWVFSDEMQARAVRALAAVAVAEINVGRDVLKLPLVDVNAFLASVVQRIDQT